MEAKRQSYWWWFDSHNNPKCSPWLQSTLTELDEKTKSMLKLIDADADSFAQRAEMYYKKRPELISMVEDFYRTHRSLAERYDQLRIVPSTRVRSPLRHSFSHFPKGEFENVLSSVKSFDSESFTDEAYNSEESAESEIDDPDQENDGSVHQDEGKRGNMFHAGVRYDELMNLREELEKLREENEIQRHQIEQKDGQNDELNKLKEEIEKIRKVNAVTLEKQSSEIMKLKSEIGSLKLLHEQKTKEAVAVARKLEASTHGLMKLSDEMKIKSRDLNNALAEKDEEKREVIRQLSIAMETLREDNQHLMKSITKDSPKKGRTTPGPEFRTFKGVDFGKLFGFSSKWQTSVVPL